MIRIKRFFALFLISGMVLTSCGRQESAAEEIYQRDATWIVQKEVPQKEEEPERRVGNQIPDDFQIHFLDVGQGDSALILCDGHAMLIDAGDNTKGTYVQNYLKKLGVEYLDLAVATHPDADHIGGMDVILQKYECSRLLLPDVVKDTKTYEDMVNVIEQKNINATHPYTGDNFALGSAQITILSPSRDDYEDVNDFSIVLKVTYGATRFLFTGDATKEIEEEMLSTGMDVQADVLKIGHHGSKTSSGETFITAVAPEYAVISCGVDNEYGHPAAAVLNTLRSSGTNVYRTDEQGTIVLYSDGHDITFNCSPSTTWQVGEYTGQSQMQEAPDGNSYNKYDNLQAYLKFQYDGIDKEKVVQWAQSHAQEYESDASYAQENPQKQERDSEGNSNTDSDTAAQVKEAGAKAAENVKDKLPGTAGRIGGAVRSANERYWDDEYMPPSYGNTEEAFEAAKEALSPDGNQP